MAHDEQWLTPRLQTAATLCNQTPAATESPLWLGVDLGTCDVVSMVVDRDGALPVRITLWINHFHHQQFVMRQSVMAYGTNNLSSDDCQFHTRLRGVFQVKAPPTLRRR